MSLYSYTFGLLKNEYQVLVSTWLQCVLFPFLQESEGWVGWSVLCVNLLTFLSYFHGKSCGLLRNTTSVLFTAIRSDTPEEWERGWILDLFLMLYDFSYCPGPLQCSSPGACIDIFPSNKNIVTRLWSSTLAGLKSAEVIGWLAIISWL